MKSSGLEIQIQRGGKLDVHGDSKLIGKGAFGCIFRPPLPCLTKKGKRTTSTKLGKITDYSDIKNEINASKYLRQYVKSEEYCILPELDTICKPDISGVEACDIIDENKEKGKTYLQFNLEYGGDTLKHTLAKMTPSFTTVPFFTFMRELLEVGAFFVLHGFIHNDIHYNNIVLGNSFKPRIIDFGRSYIFNKINATLVQELEADYNPALGQISPETSAEHGVKDGIPFTTILNDLEMKKPALEWGQKVLGISRKEQIAEFKQFWETSISVESGDWPAFYRLYWPVVDSWAIGHNLLQVLRKMNITANTVGNHEWKQKHTIVKEVLRGLLHTSPKLRLDCLQALAIYDPTNEMVASPSGKAWLEKKQA